MNKRAKFPTAVQQPKYESYGQRVCLENVLFVSPAIHHAVVALCIPQLLLLHHQHSAATTPTCPTGWLEWGHAFGNNATRHSRVAEETMMDEGCKKACETLAKPLTAQTVQKTPFMLSTPPAFCLTFSAACLPLWPQRNKECPAMSGSRPFSSSLSLVSALETRVLV